MPRNRSFSYFPKYRPIKLGKVCTTESSNPFRLPDDDDDSGNSLPKQPQQEQKLVRDHEASHA